MRRADGVETTRSVTSNPRGIKHERHLNVGVGAGLEIAGYAEERRFSFLGLFSGFSPAFLILFLYFSYTFPILFFCF